MDKNTETTAPKLASIPQTDAPQAFRGKGMIMPISVLACPSAFISGVRHAPILDWIGAHLFEIFALEMVALAIGMSQDK
jgi:hypothetical protein